jgi:LacI family transcriptional regulator
MPKRKTDSGATIWDVAKESNVSIATVSHVINNGPRTVRPDTRDRVLLAIKKLNYHPNAMARGLVRRRMNTIGVLSGVFSAQEVVINPYASGILQGILSGSSTDKYDVLLFTEGWQDLRQSGPVYRDRRADGILTISPAIDSDMISGLVSLDLAVVSVSADCLTLGVPSVDVDNSKGARLAAEHLLSLGHTRIAHITGNADLLSTTQRLDSFREALAKQGIDLPAKYVKHASYDGTGAYEATVDLLKLPEPPTAIFAGNDGIAIGVLYAARNQGVKVPEKLSVVGFDDLNTIEHVQPHLTTVHQPLTAIGELATKLLIDRINGVDVEAKMHLIDPELIVRASTAPPPRK